MDDEDFFAKVFALQIFDPPLLNVVVAGVPILNLSIPNGQIKYRNFLEWWLQVGRLNPEDPQGFATLSGPWVMNGRVEAISAEAWSDLPVEEQQLITAWARCLPIGVFYD